MYNFLTATLEERSAERERQRRSLAGLPRATATAAYLNRRATAMLDLQLRAEDALLVLHREDQAPANTPECQSVIGHLRSVLALARAEMGSLVIAARYDIESAAEALNQDEELPGVSGTLHKAVRAVFKQKEEAAQKVLAQQQQLQLRRRIQANANAAAMATPPAPAAQPAAATAAAAGTGGAVYPRPVSAANPNRYRFACDACGVKGHWKAEGKCQPADVQAYAALLAASSPQQPEFLALPAPPGTSGMHSCLFRLFENYDITWTTFAYAEYVILCICYGFALDCGHAGASPEPPAGHAGISPEP
jgi:hypothetical protein